MPWVLRTDLGDVEWTRDGLFDDSAGRAFTSWARTERTVSASPTGPELTINLKDEVSTWWTVLAWASYAGASILDTSPPVNAEPWMVDLPVDAIY